MRHEIALIPEAPCFPSTSPLVVPLRKARGRKAGSKNVQHKYIARFLVAGPHGLEWRRVYPDDADIESYDPRRGLVLKRPIASILNEKVFGDHGIDEDGAPWVKPGLFFTYKPVRTSGTWHFHKVPIQPGFVQMELGHGISKKYTVPEKIRQLHLKTDEEIEHALSIQPGVGIPEGAKDVPTDVKLPDVPVEHHEHIVFVPPVSEQTKTALESSSINVKPPKWVIDKYGDLGSYQEAARERPVTTRVTLGVYDKKDSAKLLKEWGGFIWRVARENADAYKITDHFSHFSKQSDKRANEYIAEVTRDLVQQGNLALLEALNEYEPSRTEPGTFDDAGKTAVRAAIREYATKQAVIEGADPAELVPDELSEEEANKQGPQWFLAPDEQIELLRLTGPAKATLARVVDSPEFPEAYCSVFMMRLWLESGQPAHFGDALDDATQSAWHRPWTGPNSIASARDSWTDPATGKVIEMSSITPATQVHHLKRFYDAALAHIQTHLTADEKSMVARWLQLEAKLAGANRRQYTEDAKHQVRGFTADEVPTPTIPAQRQRIGDAHPAVPFFTSNNQQLAAQLGLKLDAVDIEGHKTPHISLGTHAQHQIASAEKYHKNLIDMQGWTRQKVASHIKQAQQDLTKLKGLVAVDRKGSSPLAALHKRAKDFQDIDIAIREKVKTQKELVKRKDQMSARDLKAALKPHVVSEAERSARDKAWRAFGESAKHVGSAFPGAVREVFDAITKRETLTVDHLRQHTQHVHGATRDAGNYLAMLEFEMERRATAKGVKKGLDLAKAFDDYDFELGRLYVELVA